MDQVEFGFDGSASECLFQKLTSFLIYGIPLGPTLKCLLALFYFAFHLISCSSRCSDEIYPTSFHTASPVQGHGEPKAYDRELGAQGWLHPAWCANPVCCTSNLETPISLLWVSLECRWKPLSTGGTFKLMHTCTQTRDEIQLSHI